MYGTHLASDRLTNTGSCSAVGPGTTTFYQLTLPDWDRELPLADYLAVQFTMSNIALSANPGLAVYWAHIFNGITIGLVSASAFWRPLWPGDFSEAEVPIATTIWDSFSPQCGGRLALMAAVVAGGAGTTSFDFALDIHIRSRSLTGSNSGTVLNHPTLGITRPTP